MLTLSSLRLFSLALCQRERFAAHWLFSHVRKSVEEHFSSKLCAGSSTKAKMETELLRLQACETEMREIDTELRSLSRKKQKLDRQAKSRLRCGLTASAVKAVLFLMVFGGWDLSLPTVWLKSHGDCAVMPGEDVDDMVTNAVLSTPAETIADMELWPLSQLPEQLAWRLTRYIMESKMTDFVKMCNLERGVAPKSDLLRQHYIKFIPGNLPEPLKTRCQELLSERGGWKRKKFMHVYRKRWGVKLGRLPLAPKMTCQEMLQKSIPFYKLVNNAQDTKPATDTGVIVLNLDETNVPYGFFQQLGLIVSDSAVPALNKAIELAPASTKRGSLSLVSVICNMPSLQKDMPQFLLGNERKFTLKALRQIEEELDLPDNFYLIRGKSAWTSGKVLSFILRTLRTLLTHLCIVLILDCAASHLEASVLSLAQELQIRLCFIPAGLTWALQPLDVYVFRLLKEALRTAYQHCVLEEGEMGDMSTLSLVKIIIRASHAVVSSRNWEHAFRKVGITEKQGKVGLTLLKKFGVLSSGNMATSFATCNEVPSVAELRILFPTNRNRERLALASFWWRPQVPALPPHNAPKPSIVLPRQLPWQLRPRQSRGQ